VTARYRGGPRKVIHEGGTFLRPTIVRCDSFDHPLANKEFLCPYASVVTCPQGEMLSKIGYTLACSAITKDPHFIAELEAFGEIDRLNIGPVSTMKISWDQPHEGNMFEFLWKRRSIERGW
jgi:acyl-CoA reductase-like NAD-dependent aldehyde dehydrogenase